MKIEFEITDEEIKKILEESAREKARDILNSWQVETYIAKRIKDQWTESADLIVKEICDNSDSLRKIAMAAMERKINAQLTAVMKKASKET